MLNNAIAGRDETYIPAVVAAIEEITGMSEEDFTRENRGLPPFLKLIKNKLAIFSLL